MVSAKQEEKIMYGVGPHNSVDDGLELETGQWERGGRWNWLELGGTRLQNWPLFSKLRSKFEGRESLIIVSGSNGQM